jgi:hypothetical protein
MDALLSAFISAYRREDGIVLAELFTPISPTEDQAALHKFYKSTNAVTIESDLRSALIFRNDLSLSKEEAQAWKDFIVVYWTAAGEIVHAFDAQERGTEVEWVRVYKAWWKVADIATRELQNGKFPHWVVPFLPMTGKFAREFARKADNAARVKAANGVVIADALEDDLTEADHNVNLQDAARLANRMFSACLSDRYALTSSVTQKLVLTE